MGKNIFENLLKATGNEFAAVAADGIAGDVTGYYDTGSFTLNAALSGSIYGGLPNNGVTAFAGEKGCGKSFYAISIARLFLKDNPEGFVYYFETENAITLDSLEGRDIDLKRFAILPVGTVEEFRTQAIGIVDGYADAGENLPPMLFILDSLGGLSTKKEIEDMTEGKEKRDMTRAQLIRGAFRVMTLKMGLVKVPLICTNHIYDVVGSYIPTKKMGGGSGLDYAASTVVMLSKSRDRDKTTKKVRGVVLTAFIDKGRLTTEATKVETYLDFAEGLDRYYGLLDLAVEFGIVTKSTKGCEFPNGLAGAEEKVQNEPEKYFTKDVLDAIDEKCKEAFKYGRAKAVTTAENIERAVEILTPQKKKKAS